MADRLVPHREPARSRETVTHQEKPGRSRPAHDRDVHADRLAGHHAQSRYGGLGQAGHSDGPFRQAGHPGRRGPALYRADRYLGRVDGLGPGHRAPGEARASARIAGQEKGPEGGPEEGWVGVPAAGTMAWLVLASSFTSVLFSLIPTMWVVVTLLMKGEALSRP